MKTACFIIKMYQCVTRPLSFHTCRFYPSCSSYALAAIEKYGAWRGLARASLRVLKCSPLSKGGYDPLT